MYCSSIILFLVALLASGVVCKSVGEDNGTGVENNVGGNNRLTAEDWQNFYLYLLALRQQMLQRELQTRFGNDNNVGRPSAKPNCQPVGGFCTYHEDCCSFACLTYLKKCVSG